MKGRSFDNTSSIVESTLITSGTLRISDTVTVPDLPAFCRVQGASKPSADSDIRFEVWLPQPAAWNRKFLSTGEGGFAGQLNYQRNGLDSAMDELLRRGYATASTDTGHVSTDPWWGIGHPEKVTDYLYRAKHVTTVAAKAIIAAYYGQTPAHSYYSSCSNGGRQVSSRRSGIPTISTAYYRRAVEFPVAFERRFRVGRPGAGRSGRCHPGGEASDDY